MAHRALLTGGGSGGHVFPALAIAEELQSRGWEVSFVGRPASLESRVFGAGGYDFHGLSSGAILGRSWMQRAGALATLAKSSVKARALLGRLRPQVVVATGGYVSVPSAVAAKSRGVPLLLVEPNARAGMANRWLSRVAAVAATSYEQTAEDLRCVCRVTGVPVRRRFFEIGRVDPRPRAWRLLVLGGSQGALAMNRALPGALEAIAADVEGALEVVHQAGRGKAEEARASYRAAGVEAEIVEFLEDVPGAMAKADLILSRAGAITLAEICAAGRPSLLFPLPGVGRHQLQNALQMREIGAAEIVDQQLVGDVDQQLVGEVASRLRGLLDRGRLERMADAAGSLARPRSAEDIADLVESLRDAA